MLSSPSRRANLDVSRVATEAARVASTPGDATAIPEGGRCSHHQAGTPGYIAIRIRFQMGTRLPGDPAGFVAESGTGARSEHRRPSLCPQVSDSQGPSSDLHLRRERQGQEDLASGTRTGLTRLPTDFSGFGVAVGWLSDLGRGTRGRERRPQGPGRGRSFRSYSTGHLSLSDLPRRMTRK